MGDVLNCDLKVQELHSTKATRRCITIPEYFHDSSQYLGFPRTIGRMSQVKCLRANSSRFWWQSPNCCEQIHWLWKTQLDRLCSESVFEHSSSELIHFKIWVWTKGIRDFCVVGSWAESATQPIYLETLFDLLMNVGCAIVWLFTNAPVPQEWNVHCFWMVVNFSILSSWSKQACFMELDRNIPLFVNASANRWLILQRDEFAEEVAVLLMDNCSSDLTCDLIGLLTDAQVCVTSFAPHITQNFQILDITLFGVVKRHPRYEFPLWDEKASVKFIMKVSHDFKQNNGGSQHMESLSDTYICVWHRNWAMPTFVQ
jgi:hypothetical protein